MSHIEAPPFELTAEAVSLVAEIMRLVGRLEGLESPRPRLELRRGTRASTVLGSLAIEGNRLTLEQASALVDGRRVIGPRKDILELQNALKAYEQAKSLRPAREAHLLKAHRIMMQGLMQDAGRFRSRGAGVVQGARVAHVAPAAKRVRGLVQDLLSWVASERRLDALVTSAVVHYELEFIHPFSDGNGRIGRLWQHVMLLRRHPVFEWVPVESVIRERQQDYHRVLAESDAAGHCTALVEFSLSTILEGLESFVADFRPEPMTAERRLEAAQNVFGRAWFARKQYLMRFKTLSSATASRDLRSGLDRGLLSRRGDRAAARYRFR